MTIYRFDDERPIMDFYGTEPPVFKIVVGARDGLHGAFASADFRGGHDSAHLAIVTAWGEDEGAALEALMMVLDDKFAKEKPPAPASRGSGGLDEAPALVSGG